MKRNFLFFLTVLFFGISYAQDFAELNDYIYCADGFEVKKGSDGNTGLYSKDGKIFIHANNANGGGFHVIYGVEVIANNAFQGWGRTGYSYDIYIPSTVKYVHPNSFRAIKEGHEIRMNVEIDDSCIEESHQGAVALIGRDDNAEEIGRYSIDGIKLSARIPGINIVQYSVQTVVKEIIR